MIKAAALRDTGKPGYRVNGNVSFKMIETELERINDEEYGLPIRLYSDQVKSGSLLNSSVDECLMIENREHPSDYFKYCITMRKQGKSTIITMNYYGMSKLTGKANQFEERRQSGTLGGMIMNAVSGVNQAEYQAEYDYYSMIEEMFDGCFK